MIKYSCNLCEKDITDKSKRFKMLRLISKNTGIEGNPQICCKVVFEDNSGEEVSFCEHCITKITVLMAQEELKNYENPEPCMDDSSGYSDDRVYFPGERQLDCRIDCSIGAELDSAGRNEIGRRLIFGV